MQLMTRVEKETTTEKKDSNKVGLDFSYFSNNEVTIPNHSSDMVVEEPKKKPRKRKTTSKINTDGTNNSSASDENEPYSKKYEETTEALKGAIVQLDMGLADMQNDIQQIRSSRTLKRKYDYLSMMQGNMGQFINNKISALREINNTITKCNDFELKRMKELKLAEAGKDDDKTIMDMYNAFVSMPVSSGVQLGPAVQDISRAGMINTAGGNDDIGFSNYMQNMSPAEVLMMYENDPDVQQVVMYDESTGAKWFEVMNTRTGEVIKNADKHGNIIMEDTVLDLNNNIAKNINIGESYPIVRVGKSVLDTY